MTLVGSEDGWSRFPIQPWREFEEQGMRLLTGMHSKTVAARPGFESVITAQNTPPSQTLVSNTREGLGGDLQGQLAFTALFPSVPATFMLLPWQQNEAWFCLWELHWSKWPISLKETLSFLSLLHSSFASEKDKDLGW